MISLILNFFNRDRHRERNVELERAALKLVQAKGCQIPSRSYDLEACRFWTNGVLSIFEYTPNGEPPSVLVIQTVINNSIELVYLAGDLFNSYYHPGTWERQLMYLSRQIP